MRFNAERFVGGVSGFKNHLGFSRSTQPQETSIPASEQTQPEIKTSNAVIEHRYSCQSQIFQQLIDYGFKVGSEISCGTGYKMAADNQTMVFPIDTVSAELAQRVAARIENAAYGISTQVRENQVIVRVSNCGEDQVKPAQTH